MLNWRGGPLTPEGSFACSSSDVSSLCLSRRSNHSVGEGPLSCVIAVLNSTFNSTFNICHSTLPSAVSGLPTIGETQVHRRTRRRGCLRAHLGTPSLTNRPPPLSPGAGNSYTASFFKDSRDRPADHAFPAPRLQPTSKQ